MKTALVWFRNDLRLHDLQPLEEASKSADQIICFYCFDQQFWKRYGFNEPKTGSFRTQFLIESVENLRKNLEKIGGHLIIAKGDTANQLVQLHAQYAFSEVFFTKEHTHEEVRIEQKAQTALPTVKWRSSETLTLFHPTDLPFLVAEMPAVFTPFRKKVEKYATVREEVKQATEYSFVTNVQPSEIPSWSWFQLSPPEKDQRSAFPFAGGEDAALERLHHYLWQTQNIAQYKKTRNGLVGTEYSSKLSAWLANGCLSARRVFWEVKKFEKEVKANESTYWLIFELLWRDFFRYHSIKMGNEIFDVSSYSQFDLNDSLEKHQRFIAWKNAETGIPFIDANMLELKRTGFMSNRGRQNAASFLVKDLQVPWQWGAQWFETQLIDYDVCSNWCNWGYVSGVGTDPRKDRYFNIAKQAHIYDRDGKFVKTWLPELAKVDPSDLFILYNKTSQYSGLDEKYVKPLVTLPAYTS